MEKKKYKKRGFEQQKEFEYVKNVEKWYIYIFKGINERLFF